MELIARLTKGKPYTFPLFSPSKDGYLAPYPSPTQRHPKIRVRTFFTHCLYRRVLLWTVAVLVILSLTLFSGGFRAGHGRLLDLVDFRKGKVGEKKVGDKKPKEQVNKNGPPAEEGARMPHWIKYRQYVSKLETGPP